MLHHIPFEVQEEILKRLPVKSLIQFRSVSKKWRSLIDSRRFIAAHTARRSRANLLLVTYLDPDDDEDTYLSIVDDDTFPHQKVALSAPSSVEFLVNLTIFGSCLGLFCFHGFNDYTIEFDKMDIEKMVVVWNPSIRKSIAISMPNEHDYVFGFGVCPVTNDIKILIANYLNPTPDIIKVKEVIILSSGDWRISTICVAGQLPYKYNSHLVIDQFIYWLVSDSFVIDGESKGFDFIMSFDLTNDAFRMVRLPFNLSVPGSDLSIHKLKESVAVVKYDFDVSLQGYTVWQMKHGVPNVFMKLYSVDVLHPAVKSLLGFRRCGENILEVLDVEDKASELALLADYENDYESSMVYEIVGYLTSFGAYSYEETLLLLNQPNSLSSLALVEDEDGDHLQCLESSEV